MPGGILPKNIVIVVVVMVCTCMCGRGHSVLIETFTLLQTKMCDFQVPILNTSNTVRVALLCSKNPSWKKKNHYLIGDPNNE